MECGLSIVLPQVSIYWMTITTQWRLFDRAVSVDLSLSGLVYVSSEGVQVGGVCGAAGVVGTWFGGAHRSRAK